MSDLTAISGKLMIDRRVLIQLLSAMEPTKLDEKSTQYHIGYERAKADLLAILARSMGPEYATPATSLLIRELRREKGS